MISIESRVWFCHHSACRVLVIYTGESWLKHFFTEEEALPYFRGDKSKEDLIEQFKEEKNASRRN
jgi:hypothetical protein